MIAYLSRPGRKGDNSSSELATLEEAREKLFLANIILLYSQIKSWIIFLRISNLWCYVKLSVWIIFKLSCDELSDGSIKCKSQKNNSHVEKMRTGEKSLKTEALRSRSELGRVLSPPKRQKPAQKVISEEKHENVRNIEASFEAESVRDEATCFWGFLLFLQTFLSSKLLLPFKTCETAISFAFFSNH